MGDVIALDVVRRSGTVVAQSLAVVPQGKQFLGHAVDPETRVLRYLSVSALDKADTRPGRGGCWRRWWYKYPGGMGQIDRDANAEAKKKGDILHAEVAEYLKTGRMTLGPLALKGRHMIPPPGADLLVEHEGGGPQGSHLMCGSIPMTFKIDLTHARGWNWGGQDVTQVRDPAGTVEVCDWKRKGKDKAKNGRSLLLTPEELHDTIQMSGYAMWVAAVEHRASLVRLSHGYFVESPAYGRKVTKLHVIDDCAKTWEYVEGLGRTLAHVAKETDVAKVPGNRAACDSFGGCPYRDVCDVGKNAHAQGNLVSRLGPLGAAELASAMRLVTQNPKSQEKNVGLMEHILAGAQGAAPAPAAPVPQFAPPAPAIAAPAVPPPLIPQGAPQVVGAGQAPFAPVVPPVGVGVAVGLVPQGPTPDAVAAAQAALAAREAAAQATPPPPAPAPTIPGVPPGFADAVGALTRKGLGTPHMHGEAAQAYAALGGQSIAPGVTFPAMGESFSRTLVNTAEDMIKLAREVAPEFLPAAPAPVIQQQPIGPFPAGVAAPVPPDSPVSHPALAAQPIQAGAMPSFVPPGAQVVAPPPAAEKPKKPRKTAAQKAAETAAATAAAQQSWTPPVSNAAAPQTFAQPGVTVHTAATAYQQPGTVVTSGPVYVDQPPVGAPQAFIPPAAPAPQPVPVAPAPTPPTPTASPASAPSGLFLFVDTSVTIQGMEVRDMMPLVDGWIAAMCQHYGLRDLRGAPKDHACAYGGWKAILASAVVDMVNAGQIASGAWTISARSDFGQVVAEALRPHCQVFAAGR